MRTPAHDRYDIEPLLMNGSTGSVSRPDDYERADIRATPGVERDGSRFQTNAPV
jgi:hypothetical protein